MQGSLERMDSQALSQITQVLHCDFMYMYTYSTVHAMLCYLIDLHPGSCTCSLKVLGGGEGGRGAENKHEGIKTLLRNLSVDLVSSVSLSVGVVNGASTTARM